jgi:hypothetical protein
MFGWGATMGLFEHFKVFYFYSVFETALRWSIKYLNLDILKIEAARWKDTVSKCRCKICKIGLLLRAHNSGVALKGNAKS